LVKGSTDSNDTAAISRDHTITISRSGLISIAGGKWTTYRKMGEDVIDQAMILGDLDNSSSVTSTMQIHGYHSNSHSYGSLSEYGSDARKIEELFKEKRNIRSYCILTIQLKLVK